MIRLSFLTILSFFCSGISSYEVTLKSETREVIDTNCPSCNAISNGDFKFSSCSFVLDLLQQFPYRVWQDDKIVAKYHIPLIYICSPEEPLQIDIKIKERVKRNAYSMTMDADNGLDMVDLGDELISVVERKLVISKKTFFQKKINFMIDPKEYKNFVKTLGMFKLSDREIKTLSFEDLKEFDFIRKDLEKYSAKSVMKVDKEEFTVILNLPNLGY